MRRWWLVLVATSTLAHASPAAEKLFEDGRVLLEQNKLPEACDAFRRSQAIEARVGTLLNLAECEEKRGNVATAWVTFIEARTLATQQNDQRVAYAEKRAGLIVAKLPYLTVRAPATRPAGFSVRRDSQDLPVAELDRKVPIDPGAHTFEASAPGFKLWHTTITIDVGQVTELDIPALVADPSSPAPPVSDAPIDAPQRVGGSPNTRRIGLGLAIGVSSDGDVIYGARLPFHIDTLGPGTFRILPSFFFADLDPDDPYHEFRIYAPGVSLEYVMPLAPKFALAAGAGVGIDIITDNYGSTSRNGWTMVRVSPTLRLGKALDVGIHMQGVVTTNKAVVGLAELGVDYFFW
jgi:hypothetical protein